MFRPGSKVKVFGLETIPDGTVGEVIATDLHPQFNTDDPSDVDVWVTFDNQVAELIFGTYLEVV
jgi:hypothetical protein